MTRVRTLVRVDLEVVESWGVGAVADVRDAVDLPVQRDPRGGNAAPYVPSTSLTGALRRHLGPHAEAWLGPLPGPVEAATGKVRPTPSRLRALGTRITGGTVIEEYGATAINPARRAAARRTSRTEQRVEVTPQSEGGNGPTGLSWYLQHDGDAEPGLLDALSTWQPVIGRRRSSGHGRARVISVTAFSVDLEDEPGLTWWLTGRAGWLTGIAIPPAGTAVHNRTGTDLSPAAQTWTHDWVVREPVRVGVLIDDGLSPGPTPGQGRVQPTRRSNGVPIIPGTSWKGIFRHRVQYILAVCGAPTPQAAAVVEGLFGVGGRSGDETTGSRGCLRFRDSSLLDDAGHPATTIVRRHVAIDRISGGARDGLLFAVSAVEEGSRTRLTIESDRVLPSAVEALLGHVVRDIDDGLTAVGGGTSRGYGRLRLASDPGARPAAVDLGALVEWGLAQRPNEESTEVLPT